MKLAYLLFAATLLGAPLAQAQSDMKHDHDHGTAQTHQAAGVVKSVNTEKGTVSIAHGPVESLKWPAMTMSFTAKDKKILRTLKPGQKINFEFVQEGKAYIVTRVK